MLTAAFRAGFTADGKGSRLVLPLKDLDAGKPISISYIRGDYGAYWTIPANATESPSVTVNLDFSGAGEFENRDVKFTIDRTDGVLQTWSPPAIQRSAEARTGLRPGCPPAGQTMISLSRRTGHKPGNRHIRHEVFHLVWRRSFGDQRRDAAVCVRLFQQAESGPLE